MSESRNGVARWFDRQADKEAEKRAGDTNPGRAVDWGLMGVYAKIKLPATALGITLFPQFFLPPFEITRNLQTYFQKFVGDTISPDVAGLGGNVIMAFLLDAALYVGYSALNSVLKGAPKNYLSRRGEKIARGIAMAVS